MPCKDSQMSGKSSPSEEAHIFGRWWAVALDPPLPVYLLQTVAGLREKNTRGFPVKKVGPPRLAKSWIFG